MHNNKTFVTHCVKISCLCQKRTIGSKMTERNIAKSNIKPITPFLSSQSSLNLMLQVHYLLICDNHNDNFPTILDLCE